MSPTTKRAILRWTHIIFALPIVAYIYGPQEEVVKYVTYFRNIYLPVVIVTGVWMWKGADLRRLFARGTSQAAAER